MPQYTMARLSRVVCTETLFYLGQGNNTAAKHDAQDCISSQVINKQMS
jgi:hypothetical protein